MNSPKHLPTLVFLLGFSLLLYSMYVFFLSDAAIPEGFKPSTDQPSDSAPAQPSQESPKKVNPIPVPKVFQEQIDRKSSANDTTMDDIAAAARKPAEEYLRKAGLQMRLWDGQNYFSAKDGGFDILIALEGVGKDSLYLFSKKGKQTPDRAAKYLSSFFKEVATYNLKSSQDYPNKGGFKDMKVFKGINSEGEEFQAYSFYNEKSGRSHILLLKDRGLSRQPAKNRLVVDSLAPVT